MQKDDRVAFGERLRSARLKAGFGQQDLAAKIGVLKQNINHYECGRTLPEPGQLTEIATILNVSIDWLLVGSENERA